jgi:hypothetical protein
MAEQTSNQEVQSPELIAVDNKYSKSFNWIRGLTFAGFIASAGLGAINGYRLMPSETLVTPAVKQYQSLESKYLALRNEQFSMTSPLESLNNSLTNYHLSYIVNSNRTAEADLETLSKDITRVVNRINTSYDVLVNQAKQKADSAHSNNEVIIYERENKKLVDKSLENFSYSLFGIFVSAIAGTAAALTNAVFWTNKRKKLIKKQ